MKRKLELLCPAGSEESLKAAVANGADAVYFGADVFNARVNARGLDALKAIDYCKARGVKTYITLNTMLLGRELELALKTAENIYKAGASGVITQDLGLARLLSISLPDIELHASTQMGVHTLSGVKICEELGFSRVVLSRECSFEDILQITKGCNAEIEVFVHGAMCASVSGMCLISSFIGARSGNRGLCAQPCRLPYTCGGREGYLLSMKDMCMIEHIDELESAGVRSLKIEGRMKRPEYVGITARAYRAAIDKTADAGELKKELLQIFNRGGFSTGCYYSRNALTAPEKQEHWGVKVGSAQNGGVVLTASLQSGDKLVSMKNGMEVTLKEDVPAGFSRLQLEGDIYRTVSARQFRDVNITGKDCFMPLDLTLTARIGENAVLSAACGGKSASVQGEIVQKAEKAALTEQRARESLGKLGGTPYFLKELRLDISENAFMSASALNTLRRDAVEKLTRLGCRERKESALRAPVLRPGTLKQTLFVCQCESIEQAKLAQADEIYAQPRFLSEITEWGAFAKENEKPVFFVLPPFIAQTALESALDLIPDGFTGAVASSIGQIKPLTERFADVRGDFWLNAANPQSVGIYQTLGLKRVTASIELNAAQLSDIAALTDIEAVVFGRLPLMNLSSCPIALTRGCMDGKCASGVGLKDRTGAEFTVLPLNWGGCFAQLLNPVYLDGLRAFDKLPKNCAWRLCFTTESPQEVQRTVKRFKHALETGKAEPLEGSSAGHLKRGVQI